MYDDLFNYLMVNDMLDDNFVLKEVLNCPKCKKELYILKKGLLYCKKCNNTYNYDSDRRIGNKLLK